MATTPKFLIHDIVAIKTAPDGNPPSHIKHTARLIAECDYFEVADAVGDYYELRAIRMNRGMVGGCFIHAGDLKLVARNVSVSSFDTADFAGLPEHSSDSWAFDLYDDRGFLDHSDVAGTIENMNRIANGRAIRLRGRVARTDPDQMEAMLRACRDQFNFYADNHEAKGTVESSAKADTNRSMAARVTAVLRGGKA